MMQSGEVDTIKDY
jgi:hypothetical protein